MNTTQASAPTVLPPEEPDAMRDVAELLECEGAPALVGPAGEKVPLPKPIVEVLVDVVRALHAGKAVTVAPLDQLMTTQEAADFLGISRPTLIKALERGDIPHERPGAGRHRRIRLQDVLTYQGRSRQDRRALVDEMTRDAAEEGLYETRSDDYRDALRRARGGRRRTP